MVPPGAVIFLQALAEHSPSGGVLADAGCGGHSFRCESVDPRVLLIARGTWYGVWLSLARALAWGARGRGFKSRHSDFKQNRAYQRPPPFTDGTHALLVPVQSHDFEQSLFARSSADLEVAVNERHMR